MSVGSCRSPIRFFDPILNNALALRASHKFPKSTKIGESCPAVCAFAPQSPQSPPSPEQTVEKLHGVGLCTTTGRFGGCGAQPLHRLGSRTRQIGRVRTRPDASGGTKWTQNGEFSNKKCASISQISQIFIENLQFSKKECASISRMLVEKC